MGDVSGGLAGDVSRRVGAVLGPRLAAMQVLAAASPRRHLAKPLSDVGGCVSESEGDMVVDLPDELVDAGTSRGLLAAVVDCLRSRGRTDDPVVLSDGSRWALRVRA